MSLSALSFNKDKDKGHVLHLGKQNPRYEYSMGGVKLGAAEWQKHFGVIVSQSLRPLLQFAKAAKTVMGYRDKEVFMGLYKT